MIRSNREEVNPDWATDATASVSTIKQARVSPAKQGDFPGRSAPSSWTLIVSDYADRPPRGRPLLFLTSAKNVVKSCFLLVVLVLNQEHRPFDQS
jgi:hypothetical protein